MSAWRPQAGTGNVLDGPRRTALALRAVEAALLVAAAPGVLLPAAVVLDAAVFLPAARRAALPLILGAGVLGALAGGGLRLRRLSGRALARAFERRDPMLGTTLTNAVELSRRSCDDAVGEALRRQAVERGRTRAAAAAVWPVVRTGVAGAALAACLTAALWLAGTGLYGSVFDAVLPRFLDPEGDHPPYSRLVLDVQPKDTEVLYGGQCEIRAVAGGAPVERLWLVAESGGEHSRTVMFRAPDRSFFQTLANLRAGTVYWVTDGRARSRRYRIGIRTTPQIAALEATQTFPAYTGLRPKSGSLDAEELRVPAGTRLAVRVTSNRPLRGGALRLTPLMGGEARTVTLGVAAETDQRVEGTFVVEEGMAWAVTIADVDGLESREPRQGRILIQPDRPPRIDVIEPGRHAVATPDYTIPVQVRAEDDYGVSAVLWLRGFNDSVERAVAMPLEGTTLQRKVTSAGAFALRDLGVRPGDRIDYFFEATDNWPGGPHVATSRMYSIQVISETEYRDLLKQRAAQDALFEGYLGLAEHMRRMAERAEGLRDELAAGDLDPEEAGKLRREAEALAEELARYRTNLEGLMKQPALFDVEEAFREHFDAQKAALEAAEQAFKEAMAGGGAPDAEAMGEAAKVLRRMAGETDEAVAQPAAQIASVARLLAEADAYTRLALRQQELARLAKRFADMEVKSRLEQMECKAIAEDEARIRDELDAWLERMPELIDALPERPELDQLRLGATDFVHRVGKAEIAPDLAEAVEGFGAMDGPRGQRAAASAAEKMMALVEEGEGIQGQGGNAAAFQPQIQKQMGNSLQQIKNAMQNRGGQSGEAGYGLVGRDVGLYGPDVQVAGRQAGGRRGGNRGSGQGERHETAATDAADPLLDAPQTAPRVRLQRDAPFPLRYRDLVGEYFRVLAEQEE